MAFPLINAKAASFELTDEFKELINQKLSPLQRFIPKDASDMKCEVELEKITEQQSGRIFRAEVNLYIDGTLYRAEATEDQMEKAVDAIRDELKREIMQANDKKQSLVKRGGKAIKDMLRFGG